MCYWAGEDLHLELRPESDIMVPTPEKSHFSQSESPLGAFSNKSVFLDTKAQIVVMVDLLETGPLELNH